MKTKNESSRKAERRTGNHVLSKSLEIGQHLIVHARLCHGKPAFKGTRISAQTVLHAFARGRSIQEVMTQWPSLSRAAVVEALELANAALTERYASMSEAVSELWQSGRETELRFMKPMRVGKCLIVHPQVCFGKLTFDQTRVPVETVLLNLAKARDIREIREGWPRVSSEAIAEAVRLATAALDKRYAVTSEAAGEPTHSRRADRCQ